MLRCDKFAANQLAENKTTRSIRPCVRTRGGFTLLEVMIATAVTLLMMVALAQIFKVIGDSMKQGRAVLELNNRLRSVVHRIRTDLDNLTAIPQPPADPTTAAGYLKIFDGSLTDFSTTQVSLAQSRYGDVDDILMATVRSGDVWFTGKVPAYVLAGRAPTSAADLQMVSIASQYAEIAVFAQPFVNDINLGFPANSWLGAVNFKDTDALRGFPDSFRLHYRVLPIRPDLNVNGLLPGGIFGGFNQTLCSPVTDAGGNLVLPSPLCDMASVHQQCDLSVRRVFGSGTNAYDFVAANSLEDLMDPANRFAHVQVPLPGTRSTTMPLLALGVALGISDPGTNRAIVDTVTGTTLNNPYNDPVGTLTNAGLANPPRNFEMGSGFLHPAFVLRNDRTGEDVLASDILAFDIKVFDPGVPILGGAGSDGVFGTVGDDDGDGTNDEADELGWAGSDDLVLSPNDPGYKDFVVAVATAQATHATVGNGEYVDLAWARKLEAHGGTVSTSPVNTNVWSPFSGYAPRTIGSNPPFPDITDGLYNSGNVLAVGASPAVYRLNPVVLQPSYDTWTSRFEGDGILQTGLNSRYGVCRVDGATALYGIAGASDFSNIAPDVWRATNIDAATDGIDNNAPPIDLRGLGVDDVTEKETSPPFPTALRGLKVTVRMEDPLSRQVKQMSAAKEFVTQ
jgi:type II secretory pathway pseudopilin PulG